MNITKYLAPESIFILDSVKDKWELLDMMLEVAYNSKALADSSKEKRREIRGALLSREKQMPTVMGGGFAFPHARVAGLTRPVIVIVVVKNPVDFEAESGEKVSFACMAITPLENPTIALKIMSQICKYFAGSDTKDVILAANNAAELYKTVENANIELDVTISAKDIMHEPIYNITPKMSLREVTRVMSDNHLLAVAVVDKDKKMCGHITCNRLFNYGLPDFFSQLKSVSFISEFDPFEKYFYEEAHSSASSVMTQDYHSVDSDATLLEIVFALTTLKQPKVYVVENGILKGVIDQGDVLDQIINF